MVQNLGVGKILFYFILKFVFETREQLYLFDQKY